MNEADIVTLRTRVADQLQVIMGPQGDASTMAMINAMSPVQFLCMMKNMATNVPLDTVKARISAQFGTDAAHTEKLYVQVKEVYALLANTPYPGQ